MSPYWGVARIIFDEIHSHKWAVLLKQRRVKLNTLRATLGNGDFDVARRLFQEIFYGVPKGRNAEPGMAGSLLYHMAMVTKMETESRVLLAELKTELPTIDAQLRRFYGDFEADMNELTKSMSLNINAQEVASRQNPSANAKIALFLKLNEKTRKLFNAINRNSSPSASNVDNLFRDWAKSITEMRLRQEYETIKGLLILSELIKIYGLPQVEAIMAKVQDKFGRETVNIALNVTLRVGMKRENLQSIMLSDHYINYSMNIDNLDGHMDFLNCPIHGGHKYMGKTLGISNQVNSLFCTHFCFAHAKAMLEVVLPFPFELFQPQRMDVNGKCSFHLKLGYSPKATNDERHVPLIISWNLTRKCNLKCSHCYINATSNGLINELNTEESKLLMDQINEVSRPLLILSGGEPLLRQDVFELIRYGSDKGFRMGLGSNGGLIDTKTAKRLKEAGVKTVSISLDSVNSTKHDEFRGVAGSWKKALKAIEALRNNDVLVQVNTTLTQQNYDEIDEIMALAEQIGVENFHLFFLVPTGRGAKIADISPSMYESMIKTTFAKTFRHRLNVRPSCAPQFMRIAKDMGIDMRQWIRGCIAGLYYCRVYPNGDITPCPYLPVKLGNVRKESFKEIWFSSPMLKTLRDPFSLKGKCGVCEYRDLCGGCRARAYGLSGDFVDYCGDLHEPADLKGDYLAEDPWCVHEPKHLAIRDAPEK